MFKDMKPLPKAILIAVPIALAVWAYTAYGPKDKPAPVQAPVEITVVPAESEAVKRAEALISQPKAEAPQAPQPEPQAQEAPQGNVSSGAAGMAALLKAGKK